MWDEEHYGAGGVWVDILQDCHSRNCGEETETFCSSAMDLVKYIMDKQAKEDSPKVNKGFSSGYSCTPRMSFYIVFKYFDNANMFCQDGRRTSS